MKAALSITTLPDGIGVIGFKQEAVFCFCFCQHLFGQVKKKKVKSIICHLSVKQKKMQTIR